MSHERYISQSQRANCDLARRYVGLNLSQQMKSTQSNRPNDKSVKMPSTRKTSQQPATSTEARSHISSMSSCRRPTVRQARHLPLIVFQLLIRCVHPWAMRHPRTWSAIARSLTVISYCDCISACIIVSMSIVDGLIDKHREQVFPKMKAQSP